MGSPDNSATMRGTKFWIDFTEFDPERPVNLPPTTKWLILSGPLFLQLVVASTASGYALGFPSMMRDTHCSQFQATLGLGIFCLGFAVVPLFTSPLSEMCGRKPLYLVSAAGCVLAHLMAALFVSSPRSAFAQRLRAKNGPTIIVARMLQGAFGGGTTIVGGSIADLWHPQDRGLPMSIFTVTALASNGLGPLFSGWVEQNPRLEWRWIQYIHMILSALCGILFLVTMRETRSSVLLSRRAEKIRKETGDNRYIACGEERSLRTLIYISCTRPIYLLVKEPVVASFSIWISFVWGVYYILLASTPNILRNIHHFSSGLVGTAYLSLIFGVVLGFLASIFQDRLYRQRVAKRGPEARLYFACASATVFPVGMGIFAAACNTSHVVPWIVMAIGIAICVWAVFGVYVSIYAYLTDCYGPFASSALAAQSLLRNTAAAVFPLFVEHMFRILSYLKANAIFAAISILLVPIPYVGEVLLFYGYRIRAKSKFSKAVMSSDREDVVETVTTQVGQETQVGV
ncbi:MFS domain-containing protein [Mycena indigotica]|uniref:MFS domain-containing protein n=1 Tax=Mycena indigotica TaxID=2126181 RepID=A0A8H6T3U8_9AGAR|nr:MFS domain-containing protein [Mycena indigotica]KAF7309402.1 MFS domain-containing protein [Mycena indigotica]